MSERTYQGRVGILQNWLAPYRAPLFDLIAERCEGGLSICAGRDTGNKDVDGSALRKASYYAVENQVVLGGRFQMVRQKGVLRWLEEWNPDVLISNANPRMISVRQARGWMKRRQRPVIGWGLGTMAVMPGFFMPLRQAVRAPFVRGFNGIIAYSSRAADQYHALGVPREHIFVAYNSTTRCPTRRPPEKPPHFTGRPIAIYVGQLLTQKRIDMLVAACAALPEAMQPELWIVGDGPSRAADEAEAARVYPRAKFLGGKYGDELSDLLYQSDLFVLPGMGGLAIQQAMAHGLAVVVGEGDGTQSDLVRPENGWNVRANDVGDLTDKLRDALSDATRLRRMGEESFRIVVEEINMDRMADTFIAAVNALAPIPVGR